MHSTLTNQNLSKFTVTFLGSYRIFTARKQSLGQGNIFTSVCHSVHGGVCTRGACMLGGMRGWGGGACLAGETATAAGHTHPTGMHSCSGWDLHPGKPVTVSVSTQFFLRVLLVHV